MQTKLFNSYNDPIPAFRNDVSIIPIQQNGESFIYFYDQLGYTPADFALPSSAQTILSLLDGNRSVNDILKFSTNGITKENVLEYVQFLDENALLNSTYLQSYSEAVELKYEQSKVHRSNTAGISYPEKEEELTHFLNEAFDKLETMPSVTHAKGLYAPHIDPRVGLSSYVKAFSGIRDLKPERVVILATSHYAGFYPQLYEEHPFILSGKRFSMINGEVKNGSDAIEMLGNQNGVTMHDRAHRIEHSIELHLIFLNHLWTHDFKIIPFLVGGLDDLFYKKDGHIGKLVQDFSEELSDLFSDEDTFFLISGDLSHFGRKFGDTFPARQKFDEVRSFDEKFLQAGATTNADQMLEHLAKKYDPFRICGFPPLYTFINAFPHLKGEIVTYDLWNEEERDSAVSFGSILFSEQ